MADYDTFEASALTEGMSSEQKLMFHREMSDAWRDPKKASRLKLWLGGIGAHHFYLGDQTRGIKYLLFFWTSIPVILCIFDDVKKRTQRINSDSAIRIAMRIRGAEVAQPMGVPYARPSQVALDQESQPPPLSITANPEINQDQRLTTYAQLEKLADLKVKGILTEQEFQLEKARLLSGSLAQPPQRPSAISRPVPCIIPQTQERAPHANQQVQMPSQPHALVPPVIPSSLRQFCGNCGKLNGSMGRFCGSCGAAVLPSAVSITCVSK